MLAGEGNSGDEFMAVKPWLGTIKEPTELPKLSVDVPDASLVLEWVLLMEVVMLCLHLKI